MTVSTTTARKVYSGDGSTTVFPTTFPFFDDTDLTVTLVNQDTGVETVQTLGASNDYTVDGGDGATGDVVFSTAPANNEDVVIEREMPFTQEVDYISNDNFPAETHEEALDRNVMLMQQIKDKVDRGVRLSKTTSLSDIELPDPGAKELIRWNSDGDDLETVAIADIDTSLNTVLSGVADDDVIQRKSGEWVNRTLSQLIDDLNMPELDQAQTWTGVQTFTARNAFSNFIQDFKYTDDGSNWGPIINLIRDSSSPAADDQIGSIRWLANNDSGSSLDVISFRGRLGDPTDGAESGYIEFFVRQGGAMIRRLRLASGLVIGIPTGGDKGVGSINAQAVYDDNTLLTDYVFDAEIDGDVDEQKWDDRVPDRRNENGEVVEKRRHLPARRFKENMDELDPTQFTSKAYNQRTLPAVARIPEGKESVGAIVQALVETCEVQAIHIKKQQDEIEDLKARVDALEAR